MSEVVTEQKYTIIDAWRAFLQYYEKPDHNSVTAEVLLDVFEQCVQEQIAHARELLAKEQQ